MVIVKYLLVIIMTLLSSSLTRSGKTLPGPYRGLFATRNKESPQNPSCVEFTFQDNLPEETVQIITYGAPEISAILAMSLSGFLIKYTVCGKVGLGQSACKSWT